MNVPTTEMNIHLDVRGAANGIDDVAERETGSFARHVKRQAPANRGPGSHNKSKHHGGASITP